MRSLTEKEIVEMKKIELQMLDVFIDICKKEELRYFLVGGSAIGAIRHKGFIPWDDDIDIAMPRPDYSRFVKVSNKYLKNPLFLQNHLSEPFYNQGFMKIRNSNTTFIESDSKDDNINHGIFIDIFPIDGFPKQFFLRKWLFYKSKYVKASLCKINEPNRESGIKGKLIAIIAALHRNQSNRKILEQFERDVSKYNYDQCEDSICYFGLYGKKEITPVCIYGDGFETAFENRLVMIPENYDSYLKQKYGNYMTLPPEEERKTHHLVEVFDPNTSFEQYYK